MSLELKSSINSSYFAKIWLDRVLKFKRIPEEISGACNIRLDRRRVVIRSARELYIDDAVLSTSQLKFSATIIRTRVIHLQLPYCSTVSNLFELQYDNRHHFQPRPMNETCLVNFPRLLPLLLGIESLHFPPKIH